MRLKQIIPIYFGRYKTRKPLVIPDGPFVVVYGSNEKGKSTNIDLFVTLLSKRYESGADTIQRYGSIGDQVSGEIVVEDAGDELKIEFDGETVPQRQRPVSRKFTPSKSSLIRRIQTIENDVIRNIFLLDAEDINDGALTKKKFKNYGLGDRSGTSIAKVIEELKDRHSTRLLFEDLNNLKRDRVAAEATAGDYQKACDKVNDISNKIDINRREISKIKSVINQISFVSGAEDTITVANEAKFALNNAEASGSLVPLAFTQTRSGVETLINELVRINVDGCSQSLTDHQQEHRSTRSKVDTALQTCGLDESSVLNNTAFLDEKSRQAVVGDIRTAIARRDYLESESRDLNLQAVEAKYNEVQLDATSAERDWSKYGLKDTAQGYIKSLVASPSVIVTQSQPAGILGATNPAGVILVVSSLIAATITFAMGERIGSAIFALSTLVIGAVVFRARSGSSSASRDVSNDHDTSREILFQAATKVINTNAALSSTMVDRETTQDRDKRLGEQITQQKHLIIAHGDDLGVPLTGDESLERFNMISAQLDHLAICLETARLSNVRVETLKSALELEKMKFSDLVNALGNLFRDAGIKLDLVSIESKVALNSVIGGYLKRFDDQCNQRSLVDSVRRLFANRADEVEVQQLLAQPRDERDQSLSDLSCQAEIREQSNEALILENSNSQAERDRLGSENRLSTIREDIDTANEEIKRLNFSNFKNHLMAVLVKSHAEKRAENTKPELVRRVQKMVTTAAPEWKSISFDGTTLESSDSIAVEFMSGEIVNDVSLSSGARSLLYVAMRLAIMQNEFKIGNSLPLICDDALLYLDDVRTRAAFKMIQEQSQGHQVIYFTCQDAIKDLAEEFDIPLVIMGN